MPDKIPNRTILVADDDPISRRILEKTLKSWGYETLLVNNGKGALDALQRPDVRLALLDWMMPEADGPEICRRIREGKKANYTYILLLTGRDQPQDIVVGLQAGADDYMTKPVNFLELKARLQTGHRIIDLEDKLLQTHALLTELATKDGLTKLWNRTFIMKFLDEELVRARRTSSPLSLIMLDLDSFKKINDERGHQTGDKVLIRIAENLTKSVRPYDKIGRYGGDEFIIVLPNCDLGSAGLIAERLRRACAAEQIRANGKAIKVTFSAGCASSDRLVQPTGDRLIQASDKALYRAKAAGRNRVSSFPVQKTRARRRTT
ncbi:MAG: diguanylate cyclase [Candidatus Aminicenantes bacterium]|nr:diguanylate cyclase [Candidatus Aminicenantes bacterium]